MEHWRSRALETKETLQNKISRKQQNGNWEDRPCESEKSEQEKAKGQRTTWKAANEKNDKWQNSDILRASPWENNKMAHKYIRRRRRCCEFPSNLLSSRKNYSNSNKSDWSSALTKTNFASKIKQFGGRAANEKFCQIRHLSTKIANRSEPHRN